MQQLYHVIKQRFDRLETSAHNKLTVDQYRDLRQEQKARCQKQAWILSMFRAKKSNINTNIKNNFYRYSYEIMKIIDPKFHFQFEPNLSDETFLNDFVCLYTKFFDNYQDKFQFKVKVRNLLRPTNHNILNDMVKYLSDFSRDYSQHLYMWQLKQARKSEQILEENQRKLELSSNIQSVIYPGSSSTFTNLGNSLLKQKPLQAFRNSVNYSEIGTKRFSDDNETQLNYRKIELNKIFGILDIYSFPNFVYLDKIKNNVDVLRLRMNQIYRDMKHRNNIIKSSITLYQNGYNSKFNPESFHTSLNNKPNLIEDSQPYISHPYRVSISIQKNGFSCINVTSIDQKLLKDQKNMSPYKEKVRLSSLSNKQMTNPNIILKSSNKTQFVLNSLKVLRVSQNFLPPLKQTPRINSQEQRKKEPDNLVKRLSYTNAQNILNLQVQNAKQIEQSANNGVLYYNQQILRQAERRQNQKKRISQLRKHFTSEQKNKKHMKKSDPEQKIGEWLDKINIMKQLQRKKILGLG